MRDTTQEHAIRDSIDNVITVDRGICTCLTPTVPLRNFFTTNVFSPPTSIPSLVVTACPSFVTARPSSIAVLSPCRSLCTPLVCRLCAHHLSLLPSQVRIPHLVLNACNASWSMSYIFGHFGAFRGVPLGSGHLNPRSHNPFHRFLFASCNQR